MRFHLWLFTEIQMNVIYNIIPIYLLSYYILAFLSCWSIIFLYFYIFRTWK